MKVVLPLLFFLIISNCKEEASMVKSQSTNSQAHNTGVLSISVPAQYDIALRDRNIIVSPLYRDQGETGYRIHFLGSVLKGPAYLTDERNLQS